MRKPYKKWQRKGRNVTVERQVRGHKSLLVEVWSVHQAASTPLSSLLGMQAELHTPPRTFSIATVFNKASWCVIYT